MNSSGPAILQPTALTMLSGLAIVVAATLALGSMAQDQSGQSAAMVSKSFRMEMSIRDDEFELIPVVIDLAENAATMESRLPDRRVRSFGQVQDNVDPAREFANLLSELERVAGEGSVEEPMREFRLNVFDTDCESVTSLVTQSCDILLEADSTLSQDRMQVEIQTYAASPTRVAWIDAARKASRWRDQMNTEILKTNAKPISIVSSATVWAHRDQVRPAWTLVLRFPITRITNGRRAAATQLPKRPAARGAQLNPDTSGNG